MIKGKFAVLAAAVIAAGNVQAGGFLTNTNQNISFNRNFARDGVIAIDGVYSNPAGVAFLGKGFHLSLNVQNVYQTRTIVSGMNVPAFKGTPYESVFYQPFKMNGGNDDGTKKFRGKAAVPVLPSFQAALNYDNWGFQLGFALNGGGGKATFNDGLASFERVVALVPALLAQKGLATDQPSYSLQSYMNGTQLDFGLQFGATYKFNDHWAVYGGARFNYIWNKYEGNIMNISAPIAGEKVKLYDYFNTQASTYSDMAFYYKMRASEMTGDPASQKTFLEQAAKCQAASEQMNQAKEQFADKYLDCHQYGWGITPIIGVDYKTGKFNFATRLEFTTHFNIENHTKRDDTGLFTDGVNTPNDLPGLWSLGMQYSLRPNLRVMASTHYFFDKNARMANGRQKHLSHNTREYLAGVEWDITKDILVSCGGQITDYGLGDGKALSDMSFVTSSYSLGFGAKFSVTKRMKVNLAYFFTDYKHFKKNYEQDIQGVRVECSDDFVRTNKVLGVGVDIDF